MQNDDIEYVRRSLEFDHAIRALGESRGINICGVTVSNHDRQCGDPTPIPDTNVPNHGNPTQLRSHTQPHDSVPGAGAGAADAKVAAETSRAMARDTMRMFIVDLYNVRVD